MNGIRPITFNDGVYNNGDVIPSSRQHCEYIFIDYDRLTINQIWELFAYIKGKRECLDNNVRSGNLWDKMRCVIKRNSSKIKKVHFNPPVTVVIWEDGTKTIVRTQGKDTFDPEKGLAMAISKKVLGNNETYYDEFKKWVDPYQEEERKLFEEFLNSFKTLNAHCELADKAMQKICDAINKVDSEEPNYTEDGE